LSNPAILPVGKLPSELLAQLLVGASVSDTRLVQGPGIGLDCAVLDLGETLLVLKSDPITFASADIGWYAVQVNANDIATTGATPRWMLATLLLPENQTTPELVEAISQQLFRACQDMGVSLVGGHTEITYGLQRPILSAAMIGEVAKGKLITPSGAQSGDRLLLTKGVPIEATAILAREYSARLSQEHNQAGLTTQEISQALDFLYTPGISVYRDAQIALQAGKIHAMHDPTEGGIYTALWEMAWACQRHVEVSPEAIPVPALSAKICQLLEVDPFAAIASGALLLAAAEVDVTLIIKALGDASIPCADIGVVLDRSDNPCAWFSINGKREPVPLPKRDEVARMLESA